jgi:hypothetical protein
VSGGEWGHTRYWPSRRDSRLSATINGRLLGGAQKNSLDAGSRAGLDIFLLWLFENAGCVVDLASTTWRLGRAGVERLAARQETLKLMLYLAFTTILPLTTRSTRPGTAFWDVRWLRLDLSHVELGVHGRMAHIVLDKLLRTLWTTTYAISIDGDAVCATALLGVLAYARRVHERRGRDSVTGVGR